MVMNIGQLELAGRAAALLMHPAVHHMVADWRGTYSNRSPRNVFFTEYSHFFVAGRCQLLQRSLCTRSV